MFDGRDIATRQLTRGAIPGGVRIKNAAGWNQLEAAVAVVAAALRNPRARAVALDVRDAQRGLRDWRASPGFVEERRFMRMFGGRNVPGRPEHCFAAAGAEFG